MTNILIGKKYAVVVAHPDDEILWASSILENAEKIIICFNNLSSNKKLSSSRSRLQLEYPLKNAHFLNIDEASINNQKVNYKKQYETIYGIKGKKNQVEYKQSFLELKKSLVSHLLNIDTIYTHSPWGEYGNVDHIQIFNVIKNLSEIYNYKIFIFGSFSGKNYDYMKSKLNSVKSSLKFPVNKSIYQKIKKIYIKYNCWTWDKNYNLNDYDIFFEIYPFEINKKKLRNLPIYGNYIFPENLGIFKKGYFTSKLVRIYSKKIIIHIIKIKIIYSLNSIVKFLLKLFSFKK